MTAEELTAAIEGTPLMELYKLRSVVQQTIDKTNRALKDSVTMKKDGDTVHLSHPTNGEYVCKRAAYKGRWRMWKMVPGVRGLKRGPVVVEEHMEYGSDGIESLKIHVALGYYKDKTE